MGAFLGDPPKPLLLSVQSGPAISMPGMMDTVVNLGLNDEAVAGLAAKSGERFAYDSYRRFRDMFGDVVMGIPHSLFEEKIENLKHAKGAKLDTELSASDLKKLVEQYKNVYLEAKGEKFPSDPKKQLQLAVNAVFDSWDSPRTIKYRSINQITGLKGTAVNIQCMFLKSIVYLEGIKELLELGEAVGTQSRGLSQDLISMLPVKKFKCGFFSRRNQEMRGITKEGLHCSLQFWNYETKWK
ncbi:hypothetical protein RHMOL_Rhmol04G0083800 [Rhododendron molle]|uniref:Uncharacterized protein n=1 Tax=Rhododendron molle TaxID=49168 RepID=A0ACC0NYQ7_RHOML|nr:hypothetical protein RHMOL_Rhmol04G0083800 [Rhododendron molle]